MGGRELNGVVVVQNLHSEVPTEGCRNLHPETARICTLKPAPRGARKPRLRKVKSKGYIARRLWSAQG